MTSLPLFRPLNEELLSNRHAINCGPATILDQDLRARHLPRLLLIVAGYKSQLWPLTLLRIKEHVPADTDVCVVCPGKREPQLQGACAAMGWSFLAIQENKLSLAQNLAIVLHPQAQWIHKLDEDIVISAGYCETLEETYLYAFKLDEGQVGFVAPTLNVNGFSYRTFLKFVAPAKLLEFRARFGDSRTSCVNTAAWKNPSAAQFLWEQSMPFDHLAALFLNRPTGYDICPHRFSIGAILFHRGLWAESGGFTVADEGQLGVEETDLCAYCCDNARLILVSHRTFAGHVGFSPQARHMIAWLTSRDVNQAA
jgi:hypothetical protein